MSDHLIAEANRHARALIIERDQIRTELALLRQWQREVIQNANAHHAERRDAVLRAERAEAELASERARLDYFLRWDVTFHDRADIDRDMNGGAK
jgi:hypothetical protein